MTLRARRWLVPLIATLGLLTIGSVGPVAAVGTADGADPGDESGATYLVVLGPQLDAGAQASRMASVEAAAEGAGGRIDQRYDRVIDGFVVSGLTEAAAARLTADPAVAHVERDQVFSISADQNGATWGLDRIDQRTNALDDTYTYTSTGAGVTAYVLDTGVRTSHVDFGGRVVDHQNYTGDGLNQDCHGHGTHVAGTIGGETWGVAKDVTIVGLKVLGCDGTGFTSGIVAALDWVAANASGPSVVNLSLGGSPSTALDSAISNLVADGIPVAVAAGNADSDACTVSPAREPAALTVGATEPDDDRSSFSNYGTCLDLFAPGTSITSTWYSSDTASAVLSGTSMAAPHVAGVVALLLERAPTASAAEIEAALLGGATSGPVDGPGPGSPDLLLYSLAQVADPDPDPGSISGSVTETGGSPVGGVAVDLFASNENGDRLEYLRSSSTDGSGSYGFDVEAGCHVVTFVAPTGRTFTNGDAWLNGAACVDPGQAVTGADAVLRATDQETATIGDRVVSTTGDGVAGVAIDLFAAAADGSRGTYLDSTTTGADGRYGFEVDPGCFVVTFIGPADQTFTNGQGWLNTGLCLQAGETVDTVDAVLVDTGEQATIVGSVTDSNGSPVGGVGVDVFTANADGSRAVFLFGTGTGPSDGRFGAPVPPGCYVLTFVAPDGRTFSNDQPWLNRSLCVEAGETSTGNNAELAPAP